MEFDEGFYSAQKQIANISGNGSFIIQIAQRPNMFVTWLSIHCILTNNIIPNTNNPTSAIVTMFTQTANVPIVQLCNGGGPVSLDGQFIFANSEAPLAHPVQLNPGTVGYTFTLNASPLFGAVPDANSLWNYYLEWAFGYPKTAFI